MIEGSKIDFVIDEEDLLRNRFMTLLHSFEEPFSLLHIRQTAYQNNQDVHCSFVSRQSFRDW